ncbi:MAG: thermonuclease family protein [Anaerolineae bacterium]|nr:thermonuclease family protein [Anaerolineae bacterium]
MRNVLIFLILLAASCTMSAPTPANSVDTITGETARVTRVIDGDTIDVQIDGVGYRVRYIGVNTPESDEVCYREATNANAALVDGKIVTLVTDVSDTDVYGRLLRYVYVGGEFVNADLVRDGWAENAEYPPDSAHASEFRGLEAQARQANAGCHPTGIFDDGSATR